MWWLMSMLLILGLLYLHFYKYRNSPAFFHRRIKEHLICLDLALGQIRSIREHCSEDSRFDRAETDRLLAECHEEQREILALNYKNIDELSRLRVLEQRLEDLLIKVNRARRLMGACIEEEDSE